MKTKKAQITPPMAVGIIGIVITIISLGIILSASQKSMSTIKTSITENRVATNSNQSLTFTNNTAIALQQKDLVTGSEKVYGISQANGVFLNSGRNYTINYGGGSITPINETLYDWFNATSFNISYDYYLGSYERNITKQGQEGVKVLQDFQPTWTIVIAAFIVIMMVIGLTLLIYSKLKNE